MSTLCMNDVAREIEQDRARSLAAPEYLQSPSDVFAVENSSCRYHEHREHDGHHEHREHDGHHEHHEHDGHHEHHEHDQNDEHSDCGRSDSGSQQSGHDGHTEHYDFHCNNDAALEHAEHAGPRTKQKKAAGSKNKKPVEVTQGPSTQITKMAKNIEWLMDAFNREFPLRRWYTKDSYSSKKKITGLLEDLEYARDKHPSVNTKRYESQKKFLEKQLRTLAGINKTIVYEPKDQNDVGHPGTGESAGDDTNHKPTIVQRVHIRNSAVTTLSVELEAEKKKAMALQAKLETLEGMVKSSQNEAVAGLKAALDGAEEHADALGETRQP
jgi:hypothetical protein